MQRVLYVIDSLQTGGAERSILDIASRLKQFEPVVCHIYKNDFLREEFEKQGVRVISLNIDGPYNFFKAYRAFKEVLRRERPALVVASLLRSELISRLACWRLNVPNIGTFVNDTYSSFEWRALSGSMKIKIGFFWVWNMLTAKLCRGFLSNSESIRESNSRALLVPLRKIAVIYRGRRTDVFQYRQRQDKAPVKFLAVGRLLYRKGFEELIRAFGEFHKDHPEATLTIAGEGPHRQRLEQLVAQQGLKDTVMLPGNIRDIHNSMALHDAFVFPSHYEGFSGTLVEAMLSGIPILCSDIPMNREAVVDGETARLFQVQNSQSILEALRWIVRHHSIARQYATVAHEVAVRRFDIDTIADEHDKYYQTITAAVPA